MAIKIMIDSASDISNEEAEKLGVIMLPMVITIGDQEYYDGVNLLPEQFYEKLEKSETLPKTSQIAPFTFEEAFEKHTRNGETLIVILLSSKLSGTYENAKKAAAKFGNRVYVIDSLNAAVGERLLCEYGLRLIEEGHCVEKIVALLNQAKNKIKFLAVLGTLEYLKKGGRIPALVAIAGTMLSVKPVIEVIDGEVKLVGKALGMAKGMRLLNKMVEEKGGINTEMPYGIIRSGKDEDLLKKYAQNSAYLFNKAPIFEYVLGGTVGTHIGPGSVGIAFFGK